ncbi:uncharacterized protein LOC62_05G007585 [Vanrija pseudolonga]|uniref:Uncharacterized protein n=1 Tax=Vanrija pseudolonga TaxID=143232 RepID=A0AAF0YDR1_9TREE|nr:hypothetical protein LOC62_05G007585 [Vanrija pseudolonga]
MSYAHWQLSKALAAASSPDAELAKRAQKRAAQWTDILKGMASGGLTIGARVPTSYPAWVTLQVATGGFATGTAVAEGPLAADETALATELGLDTADAPKTREGLFAYFLSEDGQARLLSALDSGTYRIDIPEDAALLAVAYLARAGDGAAALEIVERIKPYARKLRFMPRLGSTGALPLGFVWRYDAARAKDVLASRPKHPRIEAQRDAIAVWTPFGDKALALFAEYVGAGSSASERWVAAAKALLAEYDELAAAHPDSVKHRRVSGATSNLGALVSAARKLVSGEPLTAREEGRVRLSVKDMSAKRASTGFTALRARQARIAALPAHSELASIAASRLDVLDLSASEGITDLDPFAAPITAIEASEAVPVGTRLPLVVLRTLEQSRAAPAADLVADGTIPSATDFSTLVPRAVAPTVAEGYDDAVLGQLMARHHAAFAKRRSLLLLGYAHQVRDSELPWIAPLLRFRKPRGAFTAISSVGQTSLAAWPGTILPNPLVSQLNSLWRASLPADTNPNPPKRKPTNANADKPPPAPFLEELASDIFMGGFSDKYAKAARDAAPLLAGSVYARYYDVGPVKDVATGKDLGALCYERVDKYGKGSHIARNGAAIEQAQILTTHNLALLASFGVEPNEGDAWDSWAVGAWHQVVLSLRRAAKSFTNHRYTRALAYTKDAAYALRQALFFLLQAGDGAEDEFIEAAKAGLRPNAKGLDAWVSKVSASVIAGLEDVIAGGSFNAKGRSANGRQLLGWSLGKHWVLKDVKTFVPMRPKPPPPAWYTGVAIVGDENEEEQDWEENLGSWDADGTHEDDGHDEDTKKP